MPGNPIYLEEIFFSGGLATVENGSDIVIGSLNAVAGTAPVWTSAAMAGDTIAIGSTRHYIAEIVDDETIRLSEPWSGADAGPTSYTGVRSPWHLDGRSLAYKMSMFLEMDASASQTAVGARDDALEARTDAIAARDLAQAWASRPQGQDVTASGTRSALHYAWVSSTSASAAEAARSATATLKGQVDIAAALAQAWATKPVDEDVAGAGTRSALHYAAKAAASEASVAGNAATVVAAKDDGEAARDLAREWAEKPHGQTVTGTADGYSSKHWSVESQTAAAAAAALVQAALTTVDYGLITDLPTDFADYGTLT